MAHPVELPMTQEAAVLLQSVPSVRRGAGTGSVKEALGVLAQVHTGSNGSGQEQS